MAAEGSEAALYPTPPLSMFLASDASTEFSSKYRQRASVNTPKQIE